MLFRSCSGAGLLRGDPDFELREKMIANSTKSAKLQPPAVVALTIKAVRAGANNRSVGILRWTPTEEWPQFDPK